MIDFSHVEVGDIGHTITGKTPSSKFPEDFGKEYMFITPSDNFDNKIIHQTNRYLSEIGLRKLKNKVLPPKSILVSCIGSAMGKVAMNSKVAITNQQINSITVNSKYYDTDYIYYQLKNNYKLLRTAALGSTALPMLNKTEFDKLKLSLHENLSTQKQIAKVLSDLDAKIEVNNKINKELEAMAKTLYDYWFVQFDFPDENGKPYKSSGGKMVYNKELKREIPEGWEVKQLQDITKCIMGQSPKGESYNNENIGIPLLNGPADYENGALVGRTFTTAPTRLCKKDDLVLCIRATIGNLVYSEGEFCLGRGVAAVRPIEERLSELIYYILLQEIERFKIQATGSIIKGITKSDLTESKCLLPTDKLITKFHNQIKPIFDKERINKIESLKLAELRDWLLPMLMNGQVSVGE